MAGMSKCALNSALTKLGFQRNFCQFADAMREFPFLGGLAVKRDWKLFVPTEETEVKETECWKPFEKLEMETKKIYPEELEEFFGNDPFCCVPDFLIEDAKDFISRKNKES
jgi:hypothetical protein